MPVSSRAQPTFSEQFRQAFHRQRTTIHTRKAAYLNRRPHRSFQLTRRRDYARSLALPGYWRFTRDVSRTLWQSRKLFIGLAIVYAILTIVLVGLGSQETYATLTETLRETGAEAFQGSWGQIGQAGILFASIATTGLTGELTEGQQIYTALLSLLVWLTTVWVLRGVLAGQNIRLRDGIYSAGSPIVATFLVSLVLLIQLLPLSLAFIGYSAAASSGLLESGVEAMLFWIAAGLATTLSLYWATSTLFAMIIVTLPGMYPIRALRTAGDMVIGRRLRILLRVLWMTLIIGVVWVLILLPIILLDGWVKSVWPAVEAVPAIPLVLVFLGTVSLIWSAGYIYLLYRKVVDDDALPA